MQHVTLIGNVTGDPDLRYTPAGKAVLHLGIAVNRRWTDGQGQPQEAVSFYNVVAWGDLAENAAETVYKGCRVVVPGRLEQRSWEDPEGGKRSTVEVIAEDVAPSTRFATAAVAKVERRSAGATV